MSGAPRAAPAAILALAFCGLVAFLDGADTQSFAIAAPVMAREFALAPAQFGIIFSLGALGIALGAILCGPLADRWGPNRMLALSTLTFGVFQLATAYATDFTSLLSFRILAGLGLGGAAPCFLALAAAHTSAARRATLLSALWACFPLGGLVGGIVNGWIVEQIGWRAVFVLGGLLPIALAVLLQLLVADAPRPASAAAPGAARGPDRGAPVWWRAPALRSRLLLLWGVFFGAFGTLAGIIVWMPSILVAAGLSPVHGGLVLSWHALGALISMAGAGWLIDRFGPRLLALGLLGGAAALAATAFAIPAFGWVAAGMVLLGVLFGLAASGAIAAAGALLPPEGRSGGLGWSMGIGRLGQVVLPFLMGMGLERFGPIVVVLGLAAVPALLAVAAWRFATLAHAARPNP